MNYQERILFDALSKDRAESADTLEKPSLRGVQNSVVEKYSDQAHFVYELLQNADDAYATTCRFILEPDRLIFAHNGTRHFSVSDPAKEAEDSETGNLGDVNAITSIANSNKSEASIGKFGVGFKAVFQYTSKPHIYDPNVRFRIERFIVPKLLDRDAPKRRLDETLFCFPFDHPEKSPDKAYEEISDKLKNLTFPLLFLSNLIRIDYKIGSDEGLYDKTIEKKLSFGDITAERICLTRKFGDSHHNDNLWLFSRNDAEKRRYSVGFFLDENGRLRPEIRSAFCFFPTKEQTGLKFIIHAPFLLTDSREGIRAGKDHNERMINLLANLAARAIICLKEIGESESLRLIDDNILSIIPYNPSLFTNSYDKSRVSFLPFYESIKAVFQEEEILPSSEGYVSSQNAYWAHTSKITEIFSNEQLASICDNASARWIFTSKPRQGTQTGNSILCEYIDSIIRTSLDNDDIIKGRKGDSKYNWRTQRYHDVEPITGITASFIESQSHSWLHIFYKWLSGLRSDSIREYLPKKPFFLNQDGKAVAALNETGLPILFLPEKNYAGFSYVHSDLLENPETYKFFHDELKIAIPNLKDYIYHKILPLYQKGKEVDELAHFKIFFDYYRKCPNAQTDEYLSLIKNCKFIRCFRINDSQKYRMVAKDAYFPTDELKTFFSAKTDTLFVAFDEYCELFDTSEQEKAKEFLRELGVNFEPIIYEEKENDDLHIESESFVYGLIDLVRKIEQSEDKNLSLFLWDYLCSLASKQRFDRVLTKTTEDRPNRRYKFRLTKSEPSETMIILKTARWLHSSANTFVACKNITINELSSSYETTTKEADRLLSILEIKKNDTKENLDTSNLTDSEQEKMALGTVAQEYGFTEDELREIGEKKKRNQSANPQNDAIQPSESVSYDISNNYLESDYHKLSKKAFDGSNIQSQRNHPTESKSVRNSVRSNNAMAFAESFDEIVSEEPDQDEYLPRTVDYKQRIMRANQRIEAEIDKSVQLSEIQSRATNQPKYSYGWFKALLELESLSSDESNSNVKKVSISFAKVERAPDTQRTLLLKHPSRYIPQFIEDFTDISLVLHTANGQKSVVIEAASVQSYTLRVKLRSSAEIRGLDLKSVTEAKIDVKSPAFILEELRDKFSEFNYADDFDMRANLCKNIEFVFGPPGTGKTTYLAKNTLIPLMEKNKDCKVLVLTPTNKSADVLVRKIMEAMGGNRAYEEWLIRFEGTVDETIEQSPVFKERTFDIQALRKNVTVTTIARFPYDHFMKNGNRIDLNELEWDYVVIDEASMIPIANIIYVLYKKTPQKFIIAGDPFQIEPIVSVDLWKNENIYKLVRLDSFENPNTVPHQYKVELLTTQYRSVPEIGNVFSAFAYDGILKHHRSSESRKPLNLDDDLTIKPLNIVKFPVSKYESIYRAKRLQHSSSYQIYSALFTYEFVSHLARSIARANHGRSFKIGVISPYRAQADLIDKLLASETMPLEVDVQVGTIHGFQGDECDIIVAVFNPPPMISKSKEMFLNKPNIINVSISRARDYLIVVMPDDATENINDLGLVKYIEQLIKKSNAWNETFTHDLESLMFGNPNYLEDNAFSTSHQSVNVYGLPEKLYEIRTEDYAVDIQIHRETQKNRSLS